MKKRIFILLSSFVFIISVAVFFKYTDYSIMTFGDISNNVIKNGSKDKKLVALTFDDGPHPRITPQILDILKENDAKATFFVLGRHCELYPDVVKRAISEGHELGNHTFSHIDVKLVSKEKVQQEFQKTQDIIYSTVGISTKLFRPPYGYYNEKVAEIASQNDSKVVLWSPHQDSKDWSNPGVGKITSTTISKIENGDIILFHDYVEGQSHTAEALKTIIPELKKQGYKFVTVSELINSSK